MVEIPGIGSYRSTSRHQMTGLDHSTCEQHIVRPDAKPKMIEYGRSFDDAESYNSTIVQRVKPDKVLEVELFCARESQCSCIDNQ